MKKQVLLLFAVVALTACTRGGGELPDTSAAFTGTKGVVMEFFEKAPANEISLPQEGESVPLKIAVQLQNKGAVDVDEGLLVISTEKSIISKSNSQYPFKLIGRERFPAGGKDVAVFDATLNYFMLPATEKRVTPVTAQACYKYETRASTDACINTKEHSIVAIEPVCESETMSLRSQGAPLAITKVEPEMRAVGSQGITGIRPVFRIFLRNAGDGDIIDRDAYATGCTSETPPEEFFNRVTVTASLSNVALNCVPSVKPLERDGEKNFVTCTYPSTFSVNEPAFAAPLNIRAEYGYRSSASKSITIK